MEEEGWEVIHLLLIFISENQKYMDRKMASRRKDLFTLPPHLPHQISTDLLFLLRRIKRDGKIAHAQFSKSIAFWTWPALVSLPLYAPVSYQDEAEPGPGRRSRVQKFTSPVMPHVALKGTGQQWNPIVNSQCAWHLCWEQAQRGNRTASLLLRVPRMRSSLVLSRFFCTSRVYFSKIPHPNPFLPRTLSS